MEKPKRRLGSSRRRRRQCSSESDAQFSNTNVEIDESCQQEIEVETKSDFEIDTVQILAQELPEEQHSLVHHETEILTLSTHFNEPLTDTDINTLTTSNEDIEHDDGNEKEPQLHEHSVHDDMSKSDIEGDIVSSNESECKDDKVETIKSIIDTLSNKDESEETYSSGNDIKNVDVTQFDSNTEQKVNQRDNAFIVLDNYEGKISSDENTTTNVTQSCDSSYFSASILHSSKEENLKVINIKNIPDLDGSCDLNELVKIEANQQIQPSVSENIENYLSINIEANEEVSERKEIEDNEILFDTSSIGKGNACPNTNELNKYSAFNENPEAKENLQLSRECSNGSTNNSADSWEYISSCAKESNYEIQDQHMTSMSKQNNSPDTTANQPEREETEVVAFDLNKSDIEDKVENTKSLPSSPLTDIAEPVFQDDDVENSDLTNTKEEKEKIFSFESILREANKPEQDASQNKLEFKLKRSVKTFKKKNRSGTPKSTSSLKESNNSRKHRQDSWMRKSEGDKEKLESEMKSYEEQTAATILKDDVDQFWKNENSIKVVGALRKEAARSKLNSISSVNSDSSINLASLYSYTSRDKFGRPSTREKLHKVPSLNLSQKSLSRSEVPQFKVMLLGDSGVGKSCFLTYFLSKTFSNSPYICTIGMDFKSKTLLVEGSEVTLQIWDTAGQERFRSITRAYYRNADAIILFYDCGKSKSFVGIEKWLAEVVENCPRDVVLALIGNKSDLSGADRSQTWQDGAKLAKELRIPFMEASSATGENVNEVFTSVARDLLARRRDSYDSRSTVSFQQEKKPIRSNCSCSIL